MIKQNKCIVLNLDFVDRMHPDGSLSVPENLD